MLDQNIQLAKTKMEQTIVFVGSELGKIRTGRANPDMFNKINVKYYDNDTPLNQIANISVMDAITISIQPFDKTAIDDIERGILESDLGLNPSNNGNSIMITFPPLSAERRQDLVKVASKIIEDGRISVRNIRREIIQSTKKVEEDEKIPEDGRHMLCSLFFVLCSYFGKSHHQADACHLASLYRGFCSIWNTHFCLRLQPHLYPVPVATSVGRSDGTRQRYKSTHV